jgi:hypothetical protein
MQMSLDRFWMLLVVCASIFCAPVGYAQSFAALVSPPRFELETAPGKSVRAVVEITNADSHAAQFKLKTADWYLDQNAGVQFVDALQTDSCRPWVAIERREISVSAGGKYRYRFEIKPPADVTPRECRFAIMIEGAENAFETQNGVRIPVSGRIGLIVYLAVGAVAPQLDVVAADLGTVNGVLTPTVSVKNSGSAHGRLAGFLEGTDAAGKKIEFQPSNLPILPGETRAIALNANQEEKQSINIQFPISIKGTLEWGEKSIPFEHNYSQ